MKPHAGSFCDTGSPFRFAVMANVTEAECASKCAALKPSACPCYDYAARGLHHPGFSKCRVVASGGAYSLSASSTGEVAYCTGKSCHAGGGGSAGHGTTESLVTVTVTSSKVLVFFLRDTPVEVEIASAALPIKPTHVSAAYPADGSWSVDMEQTPKGVRLSNLTGSGVYRVAVLSSLTPTSTLGCSDDFDCSLAGKCVSGACVCQPWTKGPDCAALNLTPLKNAAALAPAVQPVNNWTRWGSSVAFESGQYHLFSAEMADQCPLGVWGYKSQVIHSVSPSPLGPFRRLGVAIGPEAHNPVLSRATDGTWLLWTCGCPNPSPAVGCARSNLTCPGGQAAAWTTTVYASKSLDGPWEPHVNLLGSALKGTTGLSQNVVPIHEQDGSVKLMIKGPDNNTEASILTAPHWSGPWQLLHTNIFAKYYAANITNEDCWWWRNSDGTFHVLSRESTNEPAISPRV